MNGTGMATESTEVRFFKDDGNFVWECDDEDVIYKTDIVTVNIGDLIGFAIKDLAPGMEKTITIRLVNHEGRAYYVLLSAIQTLQQEMEKVEEYFDKRTEKSLLDEIDIVVTYMSGNRNEVGREIYNGKLSGRPAGRSSSQLYARGGVLLGNLSPSEIGTVTLRIHIPKELDSSYMNTLCAINWQFTATDVINERPPTTQGSDSSTDLSLLEPPLAEIEVIPGMEEAGTVIDDTDVVPLDVEPDIIIAVSHGDGMPQTGGIKTFVIPLTMLLFLLVALLVWTYKIRRDEKERETVE